MYFTKKLAITFLLLASLATHAQVFHQKTDFPGGQRWLGFSFVLGNKLFAGAGNDSTNQAGLWVGTALRRNLWQYDIASDTWTQKHDLPFSPRNNVSSFVINGVAYAGMGFDSMLNSVSDWWKYDAASDSWTQLGNFPGTDRYAAYSFSWNGKGYIIGGFSFRFSDTSIHKVCKDVWEYDPAVDTWTQLADFPGAARGNGFCKVIGDSLYMGMGQNDSLGIYYNDNFKCYLPSMTWSSMAAVPATTNVPTVDGGVGFSASAGHKIMLMNIDIFFTVPSDLQTIYIYDAANDTWTLYPAGNLPGWRAYHTMAQNGSKAYMGMGADYYNLVWLNDFWEVDLQDLITRIEAANPGLAGIQVSTFNHEVVAKIPVEVLNQGETMLILYSLDGRPAGHFSLSQESRFDLTNLPSGIYSYSVRCNGRPLKGGNISLH